MPAFKDYGEFLESLRMEGEIKPFCPGVSGSHHAADEQDEPIQLHDPAVYAGPRSIKSLKTRATSTCTAA